MEVAIIGAGVGGLTAALAIHHQNIDCRVRVYESAREIKPLGVGINLLRRTAGASSPTLAWWMRCAASRWSRRNSAGSRTTDS